MNKQTIISKIANALTKEEFEVVLEMIDIQDQSEFEVEFYERYLRGSECVNTYRDIMLATKGVLSHD